MVTSPDSEDFTFEGILVREPFAPVFEEPFIVSMRVKGPTRGEATFLAFQSPARYAWENCFRGDRIRIEGEVFRRTDAIKPFYRAIELCFRAKKVRLLESEIHETERDAALLVRAFTTFWPARR
jgi:hypothetical protein